LANNVFVSEWPLKGFKALRASFSEIDVALIAGDELAEHLCELPRWAASELNHAVSEGRTQSAVKLAPHL